MRRLLGQTSGRGVIVLAAGESPAFYEAELWENAHTRQVEGRLGCDYRTLTDALNSGGCKLRLINGDEAEIIVTRANPQGGEFRSVGPFPWPGAQAAPPPRP